jgi:hypothetical protein
MPQCPICKPEAEEIDLGLFDGAGFSCKRHGEFRVAESVFKESRARTRQQWENALTLAERRAALGTRPLITTMTFDVARELVERALRRIDSSAAFNHLIGRAQAASAARRARAPWQS